MWVQVHKDADAAGSMTAQRHDDHGAIAIEIGAFVEGFIGVRIEFQRGRIGGRKSLRVHGNNEAFGLHSGIESVLQLFAGEQNRNAREIDEAAGVIQMCVRENYPTNLVWIAAN